jgi:hypothetical protein
LRTETSSVLLAYRDPVSVVPQPQLYGWRMWIVFAFFPRRPSWTD